MLVNHFIDKPIMSHNGELIVSLILCLESAVEYVVVTILPAIPKQLDYYMFRDNLLLIILIVGYIIFRRNAYCSQNTCSIDTNNSTHAPLSSVSIKSDVGRFSQNYLSIWCYYFTNYWTGLHAAFCKMIRIFWKRFIAIKSVLLTILILNECTWYSNWLLSLFTYMSDWFNVNYQPNAWLFSHEIAININKSNR